MSEQNEKAPATTLDAAYQAFLGGISGPTVALWPNTLQRCDLMFREAFRRAIEAAFTFVEVKQEDVREANTRALLAEDGRVAVIKSCGRCPHFYNPGGSAGTCMHNIYGEATSIRPMGMLNPHAMPAACPLERVGAVRSPVDENVRQASQAELMPPLLYVVYCTIGVADGDRVVTITPSAERAEKVRASIISGFIHEWEWSEVLQQYVCRT